MKTPLIDLEFVVRFVNYNLEGLTIAEWEKLRDEIAVFIMADRFQANDHDLTGAGNFRRGFGKQFSGTVQKFISLQDEVCNLMHGILRAKEFFAGTPSVHGPTSIALPVVSISASYSLKPAYSPFTSLNELCVIGSERDLFLVALLELLSRQPTNRLMHCPECQSLFVRIKRRKYCSRKCVNRANQRSWRRTPQGKRENRRRVAESYEKKIKQKHGAKTKVVKRKKR